MFPLIRLPSWMSVRSILRGFLGKGFLTPVVALADSLISATVEVYDKVGREMRPTPSRPHYTFNLRDITKVLQVITRGHHGFVLAEVRPGAWLCSASPKAGRGGM